MAEDFTSAKAANMEKVLMTISKKLEHSYLPYLTDMIKAINLVASFRESIQKYKMLGQICKERVARDASSSILLGLGRSYMAVTTALEAARNSKANSTEILANQEDGNIGELIQALATTDFLEFPDLQPNGRLLANGIDAEVASRASDVDKLLDRCAELCKNMQCKGTDDWKTRLDSEKLEDYDYVLQIANETVYKNGGKPLGDEILKIGEAGFHLDMQDSDRSLMSC